MMAERAMEDLMSLSHLDEASTKMCVVDAEKCAGVIAQISDCSSRARKLAGAQRKIQNKRDFDAQLKAVEVMEPCVSGLKKMRAEIQQCFDTGRQLTELTAAPTGPAPYTNPGTVPPLPPKDEFIKVKISFTTNCSKFKHKHILNLSHKMNFQAIIFKFKRNHNTKIWKMSIKRIPKRKIRKRTPNHKNGNSNEVVWDGIRIAIKPEQKIRTAEMGIYRLVMSIIRLIGIYHWDSRKHKMDTIILDFTTVTSTRYCLPPMFWCRRWLREFEFNS